MPWVQSAAGPPPPRRMTSDEGRSDASANSTCPASRWNRLASAAVMPRMTQLHLRLRPGERAGAYERIGVVVPVDQIEHPLARVRGGSPEGDACRRTRRDAHAIAQREYGVEYGTDGV